MIICLGQFSPEEFKIISKIVSEMSETGNSALEAEYGSDGWASIKLDDKWGVQEGMALGFAVFNRIKQIQENSETFKN